MITDGIKYKNFSVKKKTGIKKELDLLLREKNQILISLGKNYYDNFLKKKLKKYKKNKKKNKFIIIIIIIAHNIMYI